MQLSGHLAAQLLLGSTTWFATVSASRDYEDQSAAAPHAQADTTKNTAFPPIGHPADSKPVGIFCDRTQSSSAWYKTYSILYGDSATRDNAETGATAINAEVAALRDALDIALGSRVDHTSEHKVGSCPEGFICMQGVDKDNMGRMTCVLGDPDTNKMLSADGAPTAAITDSDDYIKLDLGHLVTDADGTQHISLSSDNKLSSEERAEATSLAFLLYDAETLELPDENIEIAIFGIRRGSQQEDHLITTQGPAATVFGRSPPVASYDSFRFNLKFPPEAEDDDEEEIEHKGGQVAPAKSPGGKLIKRSIEHQGTIQSFFGDLRLTP